MLKQSIAVLFCLILSCQVLAQRTPKQLNLRGSILGYHFDPNNGFFKKDKFEILGSVGAADITLFEGGKKIKAAKSNAGGDFSLGIPLGKTYTLEYTKAGYGVSTIKIDLKNIPDDLVKSGVILKNIELLLNDHHSDKSIDNGIVYGTVKFDAQGRKFNFTPVIFDKKKRLFKKPEDSAPVNLLKTSIEKNKDLNKEVFSTSNDQVSDENTEINNLEIEEFGSQSTISENTKKLTLESSSALQKIAEWKNLTKEDISNRAKQIDLAWEQLEADKLIAVTPEDFLIIKAREELLLAAEKELEAAKQYMAEQEDKLAAQQHFNLALVGLIILLAGLVFFVLKRSKEKQKMNAELTAKNKKITDSIVYAEKIQKSLLLSRSQIASFLPNSFIFHQPLSVVSGDFYWFSEVNNKVVFAAVDCTGHGVPGAFMSLIGNTLLNKIVNEDKITSPSKILSALHVGIVESLHQDETTDGSQDGMDMAICTFDKTSKTITFAGAQNPVYIVKDKELIEFSGYMLGVGGKHRKLSAEEIEFPEESLQLNSGDQVFLFSDGFMDQFGGPENVKFNLSNFKNLILELSQLDSSEQEAKAKKTFESWKGDHPQLDDVLLVGCKF